MTSKNDETKITVQRPYGPRLSPQLNTGSESKTWQASRDECDVNVIMSNYARTGQISHINTKTPIYGDFTQTLDLQQAFKMVDQVRSDFLNIPAAARALANNDPMQFIQMVANPENRKAFEGAGLRFNDDPAKSAQPKPDGPPEAAS